jgi:dienelactone hydrolase
MGGAPSADVDCSKLVTAESPGAGGSRFNYESTDGGVDYRLDGILFEPGGAGPFPAVLISHGKGGSPDSYSRSIAAQMVSWGVVAIGVRYTHAATDDGLPAGADGANEANLLRGKKALELLGCLPSVDLTRVAAHGHSMGAFVTAALVGSHPRAFRAASHTAGGTNEGPNSTPPELAMQIVTPYQLHHGDADTVVLIEYDEALDQILTDSGVEHEFHVYPGVDHQEITLDPTMLGRVRDWYAAHGVLGP